MPAAALEAGESLRERLKGEIAEAIRLCGQLEAVIHLKASHDKGPLRGKVSCGSPPWEAGAAYPVMDLHAGARELEHDLRWFLGLPLRDRGPSDRNTRLALEYVASSCASADDNLAGRQYRWVRAWNNRAAAAMGLIELPRMIPRSPGQPEAVCPWCRCAPSTLRQMPGEGVVFCLLVDCRDEEGRRPRGRLEYFNGAFELRWQDGFFGAPA